MHGRIVILEDDEGIQELFSVVLQAEGFEVQLYDLVFATLSEVEGLAPDLLIIDQFIGEQQEGWEFLHRLKVHPPTAHIPLMLSTAGKLTCEQERLMQSQGVAILYQPFELDELVQLVHHLSAGSEVSTSV
jgi:CheY-like chemotaxis protein